MQRITTEINSFEIEFILPKMFNKIKLSTDWGFISINSFKVYRAVKFLIVPRTCRKFHYNDSYGDKR